MESKTKCEKQHYYIFFEENVEVYPPDMGKKGLLKQYVKYSM